MGTSQPLIWAFAFQDTTFNDVLVDLRHLPTCSNTIRSLCEFDRASGASKGLWPASMMNSMTPRASASVHCMSARTKLLSCFAPSACRPPIGSSIVTYLPSRWNKLCSYVLSRQSDPRPASEFQVRSSQQCHIPCCRQVIAACNEVWLQQPRHGVGLARYHPQPKHGEHKDTLPSPSLHGAGESLSYPHVRQLSIALPSRLPFLWKAAGTNTPHLRVNQAILQLQITPDDVPAVPEWTCRLRRALRSHTTRLVQEN